MTVGFVMGLVIGVLAGYDAKAVLQLAVKTAAVMLLMPRVIKPIMDGLTPIAKHARKRLQAKFGGQEFLIGLDPALLLGHTSVVSASLIFIPLTILIAVLVPGNQVLPFGDLATIGFFIAMAVAVHQWQPVPHADFRCHYHGYHPVDSHPDDWPAYPTGCQCRSAKSWRTSRLAGSGRFPITATDSTFYLAEYRRLRRHCHYLSGRRTADWRRARQFVAAEKATALQQSQIAS